MSKWSAILVVLSVVGVAAVMAARGEWVASPIPTPTDLRAPSPSDIATSTPDSENNPAIHKQLLAVAAEYRRYGRFDERLRLAPGLCDAPRDADEKRSAEPSRVRFSRSDQEETHGRKLYFLYVKDQQAYGSKRQDAGQVVVKEAWRPVPLRPGEPFVVTDSEKGGGAYVQSARNSDDGKMYRIGEHSSLFIMYKLDEKTPGTDNGWVYGTVTANGARVTSAGRVHQCMECHRDAPDDRMFGVSQSE